MANVDAPHGFRPLNPILRANWYYVDSSDSTVICMFDLVTREDDAHCTRLSTEDEILGSVIGIFDENRVPMKYKPASTAAWLLVADHPDQIFEAQEDGVWTETTEGLNADIVDTAGNTTTGISKQEIDFSTAATTQALHVKLWKLLPQPGNSVGANANVICQINQHQLAHGAGIAGV